MKAKLNTDVTFTKMTVFFDSRINMNDEKTHHVEVQGYVSHDFLWEPENRQNFSFNFHANHALCESIEKLLEDTLRATDKEQFPKRL